MKNMRRKSDVISMGMILLAQALIMVCLVRAQTNDRDVNAVEITDIKGRMDRTDRDNDRRFEKIESLNTYSIIGLLLNLGAHGFQIRRSSKGAADIVDLVTPHGSHDDIHR